MRKLACQAIALIGVLCLGLITLGSAAQAEVRQVYLVQNSGWMEPFYTDPASRMRPLAKALIRHTASPDSEIVVASFNQNGQVQGESSPRDLYRGAWNEGAVARAIDSITLPRKASGALADTDLEGALIGALSRMPGDGIVWIVTNNKNSPDNSARVDENTQAFYRRIRASPSITGIVAFLVVNPVQGPTYSERGLVIYGLARGPGGARALDAFVADGAPLRTAVFEETPPVRLKPLDRQPVRLEVTGVRTREGQGVTADVRGGVLRIRGVEGGEPAVFRIEGRLVNTLYPFEIRRASVQPVWTALEGVGGRQVGQATLRVAPERLAGVQASGPGKSVPIVLDVALPALQRPAGSWLEGLTAEQAVLRGVAELRLSDLDLGFDPAFLTQAYAVMRVDPAAPDAEAELRRRLPEIYFAHEGVERAATRIPVELSVAFSSLPLILSFGAVLLLVLAVLGGLAWMSRPLMWRSPTLGETLRLKPGQRVQRHTASGVLTIHRPVLGPVREQLTAPVAR